MKYIEMGYGCVLERVKDNFSINDLLNGRVFLITDDSKIEMIEQAVIKKKNIDELKKEFGDAWCELEKELQSQYLIKYSEIREEYIDQWNYGSKSQKNNVWSKSTPSIQRAYLQVNNKCDEKCSFCAEPNQFECLCCSLSSGEVTEDSDIDFNQLGRNLADVNCREIYFSGGDPLLSVEKLEGIISSMSKYKFKYSMVLNPTHIGKHIDFIKKNDIQLYIQVVQDGENYLSSLNRLLDDLDGREVSYTLIIRCPLGAEVLNDFASKNRPYQGLLPVSENNNRNDYLVNHTNISQAVNIDVNSIIDEVNLCLYSKIYVDLEGNMFNCKAYNLEKAGHVKDFYHSIVKIEKHWEDKELDYTACTECGLRRVCISCISAKGQVKEELICQFQHQVV